MASSVESKCCSYFSTNLVLKLTRILSCIISRDIVLSVLAGILNLTIDIFSSSRFN